MMQINYGNVMYNVVATKKDSNNLILMLQDKTGKMYQVEAKKIILYYYQQKAFELFNQTKDLKVLNNINLILRYIPEYNLMKKIDANFNITSEDVKIIVDKIYSQVNKIVNVQPNNTTVNSNQSRSSVQNQVLENKNEKKEESNIPFGNVSNERKNEFSRMSSEELMFYLQMHPGEDEEVKDFIRYLIDNKQESSKISYVPTNDEKVSVDYGQPKLLQKSLTRPNGYAVDIFITFISGIVLGTGIMIIISLLIRL